MQKQIHSKINPLSNRRPINQKKCVMKVAFLAIFIFFSLTSHADEQLRALEKELNRIQQESQSTYQQFLMLQELRRNEISDVPMITAQPISPEKSIPIPKYEELVQQRQEKQARIKQYTTELDQLYQRYKELENEKNLILDQINALGQKTEE